MCGKTCFCLPSARLVGRALQAPPSLFALAQSPGKLWSISHQPWTPSGLGGLGGENLEMLRVELRFSQLFDSSFIIFLVYWLKKWSLISSWGQGWMSALGGSRAGACVAAVSPLPALAERQKSFSLAHTTSCLPRASKNKRTAWLE